MRKPWFRPKRYGYGAGLPCAWEGWALIGAYLLAVTALAAGGVAAMGLTPTAMFSAILTLTVAVVLIAAWRTEGGWRWRSGDED